MAKDDETGLTRRGFLAAAGAAVVAAGCQQDASPGADGSPDSAVDVKDAAHDAAEDDAPAPDVAPDLAADLPGEADGGDAGADAAGPETFDPAAFAESLTLFPLAVQAGDPAPEGAVLWTRFAGSGALELAVFADAEPHVLAWNGPVEVADGGFVHHLAEDLEPGVRYRFAFLAGAERSPVGRFSTAPAPDALPVVTFGGASCAKIDYAPFLVLEQAAASDLDFFLKAGDTTYADDSESLEDYRARWGENLETPGYRALHVATPTIATWDDHEVENNWDPETIDAAKLAAARGAFFEHTPMRRDPATPDRIWRRLRWGRTLELFVLDSRSERLPSTRESAAEQYLSPAQMQWLMDGLQSSDAVFKLILNSVPVADYPPLFLSKGNRWEGYPAQREAILAHIDANTDGVVWLSGDFHFGAVTRVEPPGEPYHDQTEVLMGPVGHINPLLAQLELTGDPAQFPILVGDFNLTRFVADPEARTLSVEIVGAGGEVLASSVVTV